MLKTKGIQAHVKGFLVPIPVILHDLHDMRLIEMPSFVFVRGFELNLLCCFLCLEVATQTWQGYLIFHSRRTMLCML